MSITSGSATARLTAMDKQIGGTHYKNCTIQPLTYALANRLGIMEHAVVKYVTRHQYKGGAEDIRKAIHYLELILEHDYGDGNGQVRRERQKEDASTQPYCEGLDVA